MNLPLASFIESRMPLPGVAAWTVRGADSSFSHQIYVDWLSAMQIEQTAARLVLAAESLRYHSLTPVRICWVFSHLRLHVAVRADGAVAIIFSENRPEAASRELEELFRDLGQATVV